MNPNQHRDPSSPSGTPGLLVAVAAAAIACFAGPALIVGAASGTLAAVLGNWWAITAAVLLTGGTAGWWLRRSCRPPRRHQ